MSLIKNTTLFIAIAIIFSFIASSNKIQDKDYPYDVTIYRDNWGVPHIYGETDQDSKHYSDQSHLFSQMQMKPSFIELDSIKKYLKNSYKP